ncbi:alkene reductase [Sphingobium xenophagum]|uniref:alkene reductase n=1 Tax=Sphingobium xenophagum TaxID=121428 RepID=UPI000373A84F|nr:alkene reductase [Sphingobium xenophagum]
MKRPTLFSPLAAGLLELQHRVVMAPLTRMRASQPGNVPNLLNAEHYRQRATPGGLIIAEATQVSETGQGYPAAPGIHSDAQVEGWRAVTRAVHERGGLIALQLVHSGRISHSSLQPGGGLPAAPSAVVAAGNAFTRDWERASFEVPRALETGEIPAIVSSFRSAARNAIRAGFDGVELHGANGYLIEQFLQSRTNKRADQYGGSIANRMRFLVEAAQAVAEEIGAGRVGVRLSPFGIANDTGEDDPVPLYTRAVEALSELGLAYMHLIEPRASGTGAADISRPEMPSACALLRPHWRGKIISAGGYDLRTAQEAISAGNADAIAFGRLFIANPDLVERLRAGAPLNAWDRSTFYGGTAAGYTDYPAYKIVA